MLSDEKLRLIRRLAVQARNTDTGDESVNLALNAIIDGFDTLLDEIDRLRDENEKLRAARLSPETVAVIRVLLGHLEHCDVTPEVLDDWWRCYPEEV